MRWVKKYSRIVRRFALFPISCGDDYRWLEVVYIQQHYKWDGLCFWWDNYCFVDKKQWKEWKKK